jgi:hypothetical protein
MRTVLVIVSKIVLTAAAMVSLSFFFMSLPKPLGNAGASPDELAEIASKSWIGWARMPALYLAAMLVVSFAAGLLFARSRRIVRPAVVISTLVLCLHPMVDAIQISDILPLTCAEIVRNLVMPYVGAGGIALLVSPFLHDLGRVVRGYLKHRMSREGGR